MARKRNDAWKEDEDLKEMLVDLVGKGWKQEVVLDFVSRDFEEYAWSLITLKRRLKHFGIEYYNKEIEPLEIAAAVSEEIGGAGRDLGYRTMTKKLCEKHKLQVPQHCVLQVMQVIDPNGVAQRGAEVGKKKGRPANGRFFSPVSGLTHSCMRE